VTDADGSDALWRPPPDGGVGRPARGRPLPPPSPGTEPPTLADEPASGSRRRRALLGVGAVIAAVLAGVIVVRVVVDGEEERSTDLARIRTGEVRFEEVELTPGVIVARTWRIDGDRLHSSVTVRNDTGSTRWVVYDETVPPALQAGVDAEAIEGPGRSPLTATSVRFVQELDPGASLQVAYQAALEQRPSLRVLEDWTEEQDRTFRDHLADPDLSPRDGDVDGFPDARDDCPDEAGLLVGCPDADADGVADRHDRCEQDPGELEGCPDRDGDLVSDLDDACAHTPGSARGCPDGDDDGLRDADDRCPDVAGPQRGCPDDDGDGFGEGDDDECAGVPGAVAGCPDDDGDGHVGVGDQCAQLAGTHAGCPDDHDVRWAIFRAIEAHIGRLAELPGVFDPDGDQRVVDGRGYCSAVRTSFDTLRVELGQATGGDPAGVSDETALLATGAVQSATANIGLLDRCIADEVPFPWEDPASGWVTDCALSDALVERVTGQPYECNSTW
jgi:hypothetical protein